MPPGGTVMRGCGCIDTHTHFVPETFPSYLGRRVGVSWPSTVPAVPATGTW
jgi:hypothetical protein